MSMPMTQTSQPGAPMQILDWESLNASEQVAALQRSPLIGDNSVEQKVRSIIEQVVLDGDAAITKFNQQFDGILVDDLALSAEEIDLACARVSSKVKQAIAQATANIETFHNAQAFKPIDIETQPGVRCELRSEAIEKVGLYIPGGTAPLISTVMMLALPARIAGCDKRILVSPPPINDAIIYAAKVCGITDIYQVGGAQAIAALAFGTESIPKVDKIFGPGNRYVTEAKRLVSQDNRVSVTIGMPAGPSEVLVIADSTSNPAFIAADLLSQAEHGPDSQVILLTESQKIIEQVEQQLAEQLAVLSRQNIAAQALSHSRLILTQSIEQAVDVSNLYGPEHLIVQVSNANELLPKLRNAGSIFVGAYTPESAGDYASGTNHVLPTYGYSKVISSLSLADFSRRYTVQEITPQGLTNLSECIIELTTAEGLDAHQRAVTIRLEEIAAKAKK